MECISNSCSEQWIDLTRHSSRAGGSRGDPSDVSAPRAEDPQPADDILGPGCVWEAAPG